MSLTERANDFNNQIRALYEQKTGKYISDRQLKTASALILIGFMATCTVVSRLSDTNQALPASNVEVPSDAPGSPGATIEQDRITPAFLARVQYKDGMAARARELNTTEMQYSLEGADSTVIVTTFDASVDESIIEGYLAGASREGFPLHDAALKAVGFKAARVANAFGGIWERKVGRTAVKYVTPDRSAAEIAASVADIKIVQTAPETGDGHHFNSTVPIFISKEAMRIAVRMIVQGMTDPDILAPYTSCIAQAGDSFISLNGSWTSSNVMLTDGRNRGCQGWTANEFIARR